MVRPWSSLVEGDEAVFSPVVSRCVCGKKNQNMQQHMLCLVTFHTCLIVGPICGQSYKAIYARKLRL